jgi:hypothetical protein
MPFFKKKLYGIQEISCTFIKSTGISSTDASGSIQLLTDKLPVLFCYPTIIGLFLLREPGGGVPARGGEPGGAGGAPGAHQPHQPAQLLGPLSPYTRGRRPGSVADPVPFWDPWIRNRLFPDLGSRIPNSYF